VDVDLEAAARGRDLADLALGDQCFHGGDPVDHVDVVIDTHLDGLAAEVPDGGFTDAKSLLEFRPGLGDLIQSLVRVHIRVGMGHVCLLAVGGRACMLLNCGSCTPRREMPPPPVWPAAGSGT